MKTTTRIVKKTCSRTKMTKKTMKTREQTIKNRNVMRKRTRMKKNTKPRIIRKTWTGGTKRRRRGLKTRMKRTI